MSDVGPRLTFSAGRGRGIRPFTTSPVKLAVAAAQEHVNAGPPRDQVDARERIRQILTEYGLGELDEFAWGLITRGASDAEIMREIRASDPYKRRFQGMALREQQGFAPITEAEYIAYENTAAQFMRAAGLPPGFYDDPSDFAALIGANVSLNELNQRIVNGFQQAQQADPEIRRQLRDLYGVTDGQLAAFFLDPDRALPAIERALTSAQIAAQGIRTGFGQLTASEAESLAALGVDEVQAGAGFSILAANEELFTGLPGRPEDDISREEQLSAVFGNDVEAQQRLSRRQRARQAEFGGGGGFAVSNRGVSGLGSAAS